MATRCRNMATGMQGDAFDELMALDTGDSAMPEESDVAAGLPIKPNESYRQNLRGHVNQSHQHDAAVDFPILNDVVSVDASSFSESSSFWSSEHLASDQSGNPSRDTSIADLCCDENQFSNENSNSGCSHPGINSANKSITTYEPSPTIQAPHVAWNPSSTFPLGTNMFPQNLAVPCLTNAPKQTSSNVANLSPHCRHNMLGAGVQASQKPSMDGGHYQVPEFDIIPCPARDLTIDHNVKTAYFVVPNDISAHGMELECSHEQCRKSSLETLKYCSYCKKPFSRWNFGAHHNHGHLGEANAGSSNPNVKTNGVMVPQQTNSIHWLYFPSHPTHKFLYRGPHGHWLSSSEPPSQQPFSFPSVWPYWSPDPSWKASQNGDGELRASSGSSNNTWSCVRHDLPSQIMNLTSDGSRYPLNKTSSAPKLPVWNVFLTGKPCESYGHYGFQDLSCSTVTTLRTPTKKARQAYGIEPHGGTDHSLPVSDTNHDSHPSQMNVGDATFLPRSQSKDNSNFRNKLLAPKAKTDKGLETRLEFGNDEEERRQRWWLLLFNRPSRDDKMSIQQWMQSILCVTDPQLRFDEVGNDPGNPGQNATEIPNHLGNCNKPEPER